jgi:hypothetical protein
MTDPTGKARLAKMGKVFWPLMTAMLAAGIAWEFYAGVAYHKTGGPSARANHAGWFWSEIAFQVIVALLCALVAVHALRHPKA